MGCYRVVFNRCLAFHLKTKSLNYTEMGKRFVASRNIHEDWLRACPQVIRSCALRDLRAAFQSNFEKLKKNPNHRFQVHFKRKKDGDKAIRIELKNGAVRAAEGSLSFFPKILKETIRYDARALEGFTLDHDITLTKDKLGRFAICVPLRRENQATKEPTSWCAVDPGVRTFATVYAPQPGQVLEFGSGAACRITRLSLHLDNLLSRISTTRGVQRKRRMNKAATRLRMKIKHLVSDMHWKTAAYLTDEFSDIVLPPFETSTMARRAHRRLTKQTTRNMLTLSHYTFRMRLLHKAENKGCRVHVLSEAYTTKTCTNCGHLNNSVGGSKVFRCTLCGLRIGRDIGGARNIFLRNVQMSERPPFGEAIATLGLASDEACS